MPLGGPASLFNWTRRNYLSSQSNWCTRASTNRLTRSRAPVRIVQATPSSHYGRCNRQCRAVTACHLQSSIEIPSVVLVAPRRI